MTWYRSSSSSRVIPFLRSFVVIIAIRVWLTRWVDRRLVLLSNGAGRAGELPETGLGHDDGVLPSDPTYPGQVNPGFHRYHLAGPQGSSGRRRHRRSLMDVKANAVASLLGNVQFHAQARCLTLGDPAMLQPALGEVVVLSGGTSDLPVAAEAELALRWHGIQSELLLDVGVAGLQRLLDQLARLKRAKVLIACAGMEGALPTVLAGLVPQPVIGVPVSVGYGVSAGGRTALEGMLASCAPGLVVVNIDNGYGAAMAALRILRPMDSAENLSIRSGDYEAVTVQSPEG